jgi:hypothetical protein
MGARAGEAAGCLCIGGWNGLNLPGGAVGCGCRIYGVLCSLQPCADSA